MTILIIMKENQIKNFFALYNLKFYTVILSKFYYRNYCKLITIILCKIIANYIIVVTHILDSGRYLGCGRPWVNFEGNYSVSYKNNN